VIAARSMEERLHQWILSLSRGPDLLLNLLDIALVLLLTYIILVIIGERRTLWMVRGFLILMLLAVLSNRLKLVLLGAVLNSLVIGSAVAMGVLLQSEFRRFLEDLGRGRFRELLQPNQQLELKSRSTLDEIIDAVKDLSQSRTGALMVLETGSPLDDRDFMVPGIKLNAEISSELLQSIFQTSTQLHDGAVLLRESRIVAAGVILPLSEQPASRRLGTRHRAALGITERVEACVCLVVSEETGSISLAEQGQLFRPLTSSKLKLLLEERFSKAAEHEAIAPDFRNLSRRLSYRGQRFMRRLHRLTRPATRGKR
jgi:uncharacterized protein (TIGR00159 family)